MKWLKNEFYELLPVFVYFFLFILLLRTTEWAILSERGIQEGIIRAVLIFTLIIAKVFIVLDKLKFTNRYVNHPLFYNILWKTMIYTLTITLVRLIEKKFSYSMGEIIESICQPRFWIVQTWTLVLVFIFCSTREFIKKIGKDKFLKLLFSAP